MSGQQPEAPAVPGVTRWRQKGREFEAARWDGTAASATVIIDWILARGGTARYHDDPDYLVLDIPGGGTVKALPGEWIGVAPDGSFRPLTEQAFLDLHEPVGVLVSGDPLVMPQDEFAVVSRAWRAWVDGPAREAFDRLVQEVADDAAGPWRDRAEAAEAKLAEIAAHCRLRMNAPGRSGMTMAAAGLILGIAEGSSDGEEARDA